MNKPHRPRRDPPVLRFSPLAYLKLQFFLHAGDTEIGGFGISSQEDLLYVMDFRTVKQITTSVTVEFDDQAVADHFDDCVDRGLAPQHFARIWIHTHPGENPDPSSVDEQTFDRMFGGCDWACMFIIGRTGRTYARLRFAAGPTGSILLPVVIDWSQWPQLLSDHSEELAGEFAKWMKEYTTNIHAREFLSAVAQLAVGQTTMHDQNQLDERDLIDAYEQWYMAHGMDEPDATIVAGVDHE